MRTKSNKINNITSIKSFVIISFCCFILQTNTKRNKNRGIHIDNFKESETEEESNFSLVGKDIIFGVKVALNMKHGGIEVNFRYPHPTHFSIVLKIRSDTASSSIWRSIAYDGYGRWAVQYFTDERFIDISGPTLSAGNTYRLWLCFIDNKLKAFLNHTLLYADEEIVNVANHKYIDVTLLHTALKIFSFHNIKMDIELKNIFSAMRERWKTYQIGNLDKIPELIHSKIIQTHISKLSEKALFIYDQMNKNANRKMLWTYRSRTEYILIEQFKMLNILATAYGTNGTVLYKKRHVLNDIVSGLDFMTQRGYYAGTGYFGNWWIWQIGIPKLFISTIMILYDEIEKKKINKYIKIISKYVPNLTQPLYSNLDSKVNFTLKGANNVDVSLSVLGLGLLTENPDKLSSVVRSIYEVIKTVEQGTGFYADYSYIQHKNIPSTGSYGLVLLDGICQILSILLNTFWDLNQDFKNSFIDIVKNAYIPLITQSQIMHMVSGRAFTRPFKYGQINFLFDFLISSHFANEEDRQILRQAAKYWIIQNKQGLENVRNINDLLAVKTILEDESLNVRSKPFIGSRIYGAMDRFVYSDNTITLGISMHSYKTGVIESFNGENKKGWHTSDGMVYLYNNDLQFGYTFWPTVDWQALPGTTISKQMFGKSEKSKERFVGGVTDKTDAVVSMQLNKIISQRYIKAKKSWFIFDGKIICLGSDISGNSADNVETIVENRLLDPESSYVLIDQNGNDVSKRINLRIKPFNWLLLYSSKVNQNIGYVMLQNQYLMTERVQRSGTYKDINDWFLSDDVLYKGTYQKITISHDNVINGGSYAYLIYPKATFENLNYYCNQNKLRILSNTADVQAVKDEDRNLLGATVWTKFGATIGGIKIKQPASLLYKLENNNQATLSISNPEQTNVILELKLPHLITEVIRKDTGIMVLGIDKITVNTTRAFGKTFQIKFKYHH